MGLAAAYYHSLKKESITLLASANAYARGGTFGNTVQDAAASLQVKHNAALDTVRVAFVRFENVPAVASAVLELTLQLETTYFTTVNVYLCSNNWDPATLTYNNMPAAGQLLGSVTILQGEPANTVKAALLKLSQGGTLSFRLEAATASTPSFVFHSIQSGGAAKQPKLVI